MTFREVARAVYSEMGRLPPEARDELAATKTYDPVFGTTTCATHIATLGDRSGDLRGEARPLRGRGGLRPASSTRMIVDGQVHGGVAQGIGAALYEEVVYDDEGQIHTASLVDYLVPAASEIPRDAGGASRERYRRPRWAAFAAWARVAPSARRPRSRTRSPTRCRRSGSRSTSFR